MEYVCFLYSKFDAYLKEWIGIILDRVKKPLVLIGMMGSGKSYVGKALALKTGVAFYEMDLMIEEAQGCSIPHIFETHGEVYFRALESALLAELLEKGFCIISTGGGVVMSPLNMEAIGKKAVSVWLGADVPVMLARVGAGEGRPLLLQNNDPAGALEDLLNVREALYSKADIHVSNNSDDGTEPVTEEILLRTGHKI